jgi:hypothetical protein
MPALLYQDGEYPLRNDEERAGSAAPPAGRVAAAGAERREGRCR